MIRVISVEAKQGHTLRIGFSDDTERDVDIDPYLNGPIFEPLKKNMEFFRSVAVDAELGTIVWPNGADIDPDVLYLERIPAAWEAPAR